MLEGGGETKLLEFQAQDAEGLDQDRRMRNTHVVEYGLERASGRLGWGRDGWLDAWGCCALEQWSEGGDG